MKYTTEFKNRIMNWLQTNGFSNITEIRFTIDFAYVPKDGIINIGLQNYSNTGAWFEEFLSAHGCKYADIPFGIMAFLHEVGHSQTVNTFSQEELLWCSFLKENATSLEDAKSSSFKYWCVPDEMAANKWVIDFVNNHIMAVANLWTNIFEPLWELMLSEDHLWEQVNKEGEI